MISETTLVEAVQRYLDEWDWGELDTRRPLRLDDCLQAVRRAMEEIRREPGDCNPG